MIETLLGGFMGGVLRILPEVLKYLDSRNERKHELALGRLELERTQLQYRGQLAITDREVEGSQFVTAMEAMREGIEAQGKQTGIKWIDAISATVRPVITYWIFGLYSAVKATTLTMTVEAGTPLDIAVVSMWSPADDAMLSAILTFWFVGRVWERVGGRF